MCIFFIVNCNYMRLIHLSYSAFVLLNIWVIFKNLRVRCVYVSVVLWVCNHVTELQWSNQAAEYVSVLQGWIKPSKTCLRFTKKYSEKSNRPGVVAHRHVAPSAAASASGRQRTGSLDGCKSGLNIEIFRLYFT